MHSFLGHTLWTAAVILVFLTTHSESRKSRCDLCWYDDVYNVCSMKLWFWVQNLEALKEVKDCEQKKMEFLSCWLLSSFLFELGVKSIWNKEQNVSRSTYLVSKYGKRVSYLFFIALKWVSVKEFQILFVFFRNYVNLLYFSIFTIKYSDCYRVCTSEILPMCSPKESFSPA